MHMYLLAYVCMSVCAWYVIIDDGKGYEISLEHKCLSLSGSWGLPSYEYSSSSFRIRISFQTNDDITKIYRYFIILVSCFDRYLNIYVESKFYSSLQFM